MSKTEKKGLTHEQFWSRMEKNSSIVERMPAWVKGSPVNQRVETTGKAADKTVIVKSEPNTDR